MESYCIHWNKGKCKLQERRCYYDWLGLTVTHGRYEECNDYRIEEEQGNERHNARRARSSPAA